MTLFEMLVVLAIIGVVTEATMITIAPRRGGSIKTEAQLLSKTIENVADDARVREIQTTLVIKPDSYHFVGARDLRHVLSTGIVFKGITAASLPLNLDTDSTIELSLVRGDERWLVTFDGTRAHAVEAESVP